MDPTYILLLVAIVVPIIVFALTPFIAERLQRLTFRPRVSVECYQCLEPYVADCSAVCTTPV